MLSGREYTYYGYESDNIGIRNNGVEYVTDADGNVVYTDVYNYESSGNNDAPLKEGNTSRTELTASWML